MQYREEADIRLSAVHLKKSIFFVFFLLCFFSVFLCYWIIRSPLPPPPHTQGNTLRIGGVLNRQIGLNHLSVHDSDNILPLQFIHSGLIKFSSSDDKVVPDLAEKWSVSDDFKSIRFVLRNNACFHDGSLVTLQDVKNSYETYMKPDSSKGLSYFSFIKSIELEGRNTIIFTFNKVFPSPEYYFSLWIFPSHIKKSKFSLNPVGAGPYRFIEMKEDGSVLLRRNEKYYAEKGNPEYLFFRSYPNKKALWSGFMRREVDLYMKLDHEQLSMLEKADWCSIVQLMDLKCFMLILNGNQSFLKDKKVRCILSSLINKEELVQKVFKGHAMPVEGPLLNNPPGYSQEKSFVDDPLKTLNKLGFQDTDEDGILEKEGRPFILKLSISNDSKEYLNLSKVIKTQFKKAGIKVEIILYKNPEEWAQKVYYDSAFDFALCEKTIGFKERSLIYWLKEMGNKAFLMENSDLFSEKYWKMQQRKDSSFKYQMLMELLKMIDEEKRFIFLVHPLNYYVFNARLDYSGIKFAYSFYLKDLSQIILRKGEKYEIQDN